MPTGYTHAVQDGKITTLREFALTCARAFGACITMRDDPSDAPIPERFEPHTDYHDRGIAEARAILAELPGLSVAECNQRAQNDFDAALASHTDREVERTRQRTRYEQMVAKVEGWKVPDDLREMRSFMLDQLRSSIDHDCNIGRYDPAPVLLGGSTWRDKRLEEASRSLAYHTVERQKEIDRTESRNAWLKALRDCLPPAEPSRHGFV